MNPYLNQNFPCFSRRLQSCSPILLPRPLLAHLPTPHQSWPLWAFAIRERNPQHRHYAALSRHKNLGAIMRMCQMHNHQEIHRTL